MATLTAKYQQQASDRVQAYRDMARKDAGGGSGMDSFSPGASGSRDRAAANQQYGALYGPQFIAMRPIAIKVADRPLRIGVKQREAVAGKPMKKAWMAERPERLPWRKHYAPGFMQKQLGMGVEVLESHTILDALENPNPFTTQWALLYNTALSMLATGRGFWWYDEDNKTPGPRGEETPSIWYVPSHWMTPVHRGEESFAAWKFKKPGSSDEIEIPGRDVVYFVIPDPSDPHGYKSPLQSQSKAVNAYDKLADAHYQCLNRSINPSAIVTVGKLPSVAGRADMRPMLTTAQRKQIYSVLRNHMQGVQNNGNPFIIDGLVEGIDIRNPGMQELGYLDGAAHLKEQIQQGIGTPPIMAGKTDNANRAGSVVAHNVAYEVAVNPIVTQISQCLTMQLGRRISTDNEQYYIWLELAKANDSEMMLKRFQACQAAFTTEEQRQFAITGEMSF